MMVKMPNGGQAEKTAQRIRPLAVAMPLCNGDPLCGALMVEINFRADITKYYNGKNPFVVFSYAEWSGITGLSPNQLRKAFARLVTFGLVNICIKPHPHKNVLKVLHVEVPWAIQDMFTCLRSGKYEYLGNALKMDKFEMAFQFPCRANLNSPEVWQTNAIKGYTPDVHGGAHQLCASGSCDGVLTDVTHADKFDASAESEHNKKKLKKKIEKSKPSKDDGNNVVVFLKKKVKKKIAEIADPVVFALNIPDDLRMVAYLPQLLIALRIAHANTTAKQTAIWKSEVYFTRKEATDMWRTRFKAQYGSWASHHLGENEKGLLGTILHLHGAGMTKRLIENVILRWNEVLAIPNTEDFQKPPYPEIVFVFCYVDKIIAGLSLQK